MRGVRRSRAAVFTAKAMEGVKSLDAALMNLPAYGAWNVKRVAAGTGEALPGPAAAESRRSVSAYNRFAPGSGRVPGGRRRRP